MFDKARIRESTNLQQVEIHQKLKSTNDRALELLRQDKLTTPALILAEQQTDGRGQRDRRWWSGDGSLTFSWIKGNFEATGQVNHANRLLPMASALAIVGAIESLTDLTRISIKWPNDLIVSGRKICGVLIESVSVGTGTAIVTGIGINVNNEDLSPREIDSLETGTGNASNPTSIFVETDQRTPLDDLLIAVIVRLESESELARTDPAAIVKRCNQRLAFYGETINVVSPSGIRWVGKCQGIGIDGGLVLKIDQEELTIYSGMITDW